MKNEMNLVTSALSKLDDDELMSLRMIMPWQQDAVANPSEKDEDGFSINAMDSPEHREQLQRACWNKFNQNPFVGTAVRGQVGRLTGLGFEITSEISEIQEVIEEVTLDPRNGLYTNWSKYAGRAVIEGELFLLLSLHEDGFIEVDFIDPTNISGGGEDGIIYHPDKSTFPLFYFVSKDTTKGISETSTMLVPSINIGYYPELIKIAKKQEGFSEAQTKSSKSSKNTFNKIGGYRRFMVSWDKSFVTRRNISYLRTVLEWLNHYENLKKYEIDHKKSAGAYLWVIEMEDPKTFRTWLSLSDEDRRKTGIMAKKTPGSTLVLPPGMKVTAQNPKLPTISESDTDILHMVTGGLNEPEDVSTGQSKGTFASVKASRGPMSDRMSDEIAYFERFLRYDFYRPVFFLKSKISDFPETFKQREAVDFKSQKPVFKDVDRKPESLIDITFPVSEVNDAETRARAYLGVKHGSVYDTLGIPNDYIAKKLGIGNYRKMRLQQATEEDRYPELEPPVDAAGEQLDPGNKAEGKGKAGVPAKPGVPAKKVIKRPVPVKQSLEEEEDEG
jgi:hypothetical protein